MANCANCGEPNSPECENCTRCGKPVGGIRSTPPVSPTGGQTVFGTGSIGAKGKWFSGIQSLGETAAREIAEQTSSVGPTDENNRVKKIGTGLKKSIVYTIPQINIPVANTEEYEESSNTELYIPATGTEIGNGSIDYAKFAEKMAAQATELANNLQSLKDQKGVSSGAGAGVPDGPDCETDVDYPANTFHIEAKTKFEVVPCEDENIIELYNGIITLTIEGGNLTISGATTVNVVEGELQEGGVRVATRGWVTDNFSENDHTHTFSGTGSDGNTSITISGTTSGPST